ncbi:MAG: putative 4-hydroxybenzoate polyprenyltransferase [bacterium]|nr:putative 4-hydroxybenzoate polyprenyltransferase [bacterium]
MMATRMATTLGEQSRLFLQDIRISHTLFALPFAYVGAVVAGAGHPSLPQLLWITVAMLGARTTAMAANRLLDREIDRLTPRTKNRPLASGRLRGEVMWAAAACGLVLLLVGAWELNPLCVKLLPIAAVGLLTYPLFKRFTWGAHLMLGAVDALAPLGAYVGVAAAVRLPALLLFLAVLLWVAGFDLPYALMDADADRSNRVHSFVVAFGEHATRRAALLFHAAATLLLALAGAAAGAGAWWYAVLPAGAALIAYEASELRSTNVLMMNDRIFKANMLFSLAVLAASAAGYLA